MSFLYPEGNAVFPKASRHANASSYALSPQFEHGGNKKTKALRSNFFEIVYSASIRKRPNFSRLYRPPPLEDINSCSVLPDNSRPHNL